MLLEATAANVSSIRFVYEANKIAKIRKHERINVLVSRAYTGATTHVPVRLCECVSFRFGVLMLTQTNIQRLKSFRTTTEKVIQTQKPRAILLL